MAELTMDQYLSEIEYAVRTLLDATWHEHEEVHRLAHEVDKLSAATSAGYNRAESINMGAENPDDVAMAAGAHWETYFGVDKERHAVQASFDELAARLRARSFSTASLAGDVLQHAKQGISIVHGGPQQCPGGRLVSDSQSLKTVIWQGRNQAIHWEDGNLSKAVQTCFSALKDEAHQHFADIYDGSLAFHVLNLLGWRSWDEFSSDLRSLG